MEDQTMKDIVDRLDFFIDEGRTVTPKYVVDVQIKMGIATPAAWEIKEYGKPTVNNLKKYIEAYNQSLMAGGANQHIGSRGMATWAGIRENAPNSPYIVEWGRKR